MGRISKTGLILLVLIVLAGCTTQKRKGDLSALGKLYHNTTARYNGYFNANELMKASTLQLEEQHQDNYSQLLEMYEYVAADNPQAVAEQLDEAIKKVSIVVNLHRQSHWSDDCYLLVGQAQFLKKDYEGAEETFRYLLEEYSPRKMARLEKKSQKKKGKQVKGKSRAGTEKARKADSGSEEKEVKSAKEAARDRKKYNRELKKKKKQRSSSSSKKKKKSSSGKKTDAARSPRPRPDTQKPAEEQELTPPEKESEPTAPAPEPEITTIRLSDNAPQDIESDPESYFLKHRPAYQEGLLWLAKTLIERDNYDAALRTLSQLERDPKTFDDIRRQAAGVQAYYFIKRKDHNQAIAYLERAVDLETDRPTKARFTYIKAQLHQMLGQSEAAYAAFQQALKYSNNYEMEFSAQLNLALNAWRSGKGTGDDARRNLEKMLKDPKNAEYLGPIYYALGEIALESGDREEAIKNYLLAVEKNTGNQAQKAEAFYRLAKLFFEQEDFVEAKKYFQQTEQSMGSNDPRYEEVQRYNRNLTEIAENLQTITMQDSLLRLSRMTDDERLALAARKKKEQDDARLKEALSQGQQAPQAGARAVRSGAPTAAARTAALKESSFFAYNDRSLKNGRRTFEREWGSRPLEDDWRRSNRRNQGVETENIAREEAPVIGIDPGNVEQYIGSFPKTVQEQEQANLLIKEAMYKLGTLYRERLENYPRTIDILEQLNQRFPGNTFELDSWYVLYLTYKDVNNQAKAQEYYDRIIGKFPTSNYARILQDPSYADKYLNEERRLNQQYDEIYRVFTQGRFQDAFDRGQKAAAQLVGKHPLKPRYALLLAMCAGSLKGKEDYISELQRVVAMYPDTDEQRRAREILRMLGGAAASLPGQAEEESSAFTFNENELHYVLIVFQEDLPSMNDAKISVSDYNQKYHELDKLRLTNIYIGENNKTPVLVLRRFKDKNEAMRYYQGVQRNKNEYIKGNIPYEIYPVSQNNYRQVLKAKSVAGYQRFFEENYF